MARMAIIVSVLGMCMPEILQAEVIIEAGEIDSSTVEIGAYVVVIYGEGERHSVSGKWERMATVRGYIKTIDSERLTIGIRSWKTEIERDQIYKLIIARSADKITEKSRLSTDLALQAGYFVSKSGTGYIKALPTSASIYFGDYKSESPARIGLRCAYQKVRNSQLFSLLLVYQQVSNNRKRVAVLSEVAFGFSVEDFVNSLHIRFRPQGSFGGTILVPIQPRIGVQATAKVNVFWQYYSTFGMSVTIGPFLRF